LGDQAGNLETPAERLTPNSTTESPNKKSTVELIEYLKQNSNWNEVQHQDTWATIIADENPLEKPSWKLPGTKEPREYCGKWVTEGCLNVEAHGKLRPDGSSYPGKAFIKRFKKSCYRAECSECDFKWNARESNKATRRIETFQKKVWKKFKKKVKPVHVVASPPSSDYKMGYKKLRKKVYEKLKNVGVRGGACVYHPFKRSLLSDGSWYWYFSPHFHIVCFGWVEDVGEEYRNSGYVIINKGVRDSVFATFYYLLSHAGVYKGRHSLTWFGTCAYGKLHSEPEPKKHLCPICKDPLRPVAFIGTDRGPPDEEFERYLDAEEWGLSSDKNRDVRICKNGIVRTVRPYLDHYGGLLPPGKKVGYPAIKAR